MANKKWVINMSELAIEGGKPIRQTLLSYARQSVDEDDIAAMVDVLRSDWLTTGPKIPAFEEEFAARVGAKYAVAVSNGTAALHAAAFAARIGPGDEVIVPAMTFAASANCVRYLGGTVVFADVRRDNLNLDPECAEAAITSHTRAIVTVDYTGQPSDLDQLGELTQHHGLLLIEDASHALGGTYHGAPVGALSNLTTFSFHPVKQITTGEGGMITTDDPDLAARCRLLRNHGITSDHRQREKAGSWFYEMVELGYNYRLTDFQCALGISQLKKLSGWIERRRAIASMYDTAFSTQPEIEPPLVLPDRESAWHLYIIRLKTERLQAGRAEIFKALRAENIGVNVHYIPVPWHPYYQQLGYGRGHWPVAEDAYDRMISLPMWPGMTDQDVEDVIFAVQKVLVHFKR
jgi:perosamine synthetase